MHPPGEAREDWATIRAIAEGAGATLPFNTLAQLRAAMPLSLHFVRRGCTDSTGPAGGTMSDAPFAPATTPYHLADAIARASDVMAECARTYAAPPALAAE
ncbi:hypothetical protein J4558_11970 [Leptolyngbya sp. 15MV]|nr:hypothetical protein J4558_11970 [Leptolyngbya sp. 15MV]